MKKVLSGILLVVYSVVAITVTVLLLSYNDYNCSELGGYTVYIVNDDSMEPEYKQGSIILMKHTSDKNINIGDQMFMYKVISKQEYEMVTKTVQEKLQHGTHSSYVVEEQESYADDYFIGKTSDAVVIEGWGYVLGLLESKWGYLFCVVIVSLMLFLQEVFELAMEIKYGKAERQAQAERERAERERAERIERARGNAKKSTAKATTAKTATAKTATAKPATKRVKKPVEEVVEEEEELEEK